MESSFWNVTLLSILQGVAEFLPISSSGHLVLGKHLLGMQELGLRLDVFLHLGTLLAIAVFYWRVIRRILVEFDWMYGLKVVVSAIPAGLVGVFFKDDLERAFQSACAVGCALLFTGVVLLATRFLPRGTREVSVGRAWVMGLAQMVAILPGVSRSGMTLAAARVTKVEATKSAEFSFLMSAPLIVGAALLELIKSLKVAEIGSEVSWPLTIYGAALASLVGYFSLAILLRVLKGKYFWLFGVYCLAAGLLTLFLV